MENFLNAAPTIDKQFSSWSVRKSLAKKFTTLQACDDFIFGIKRDAGKKPSELLSEVESEAAVSKAFEPDDEGPEPVVSKAFIFEEEDEP